MYKVELPRGWAWERGEFSVKKFSDWVKNNNISTQWNYEIIDDILVIYLPAEQDVVAFKLKFLNNNKEPELF